MDIHYYKVNRERIRAYQAEYYRQNKDAARTRMRRGKGIPEPTRPCPNHCECCGELFTRPCADHCHITGKFRSWLCVRCNAGLGQFRHDPVRLRQAADFMDIIGLLGDLP